jgi:hypothetical protein
MDRTRVEQTFFSFIYGTVNPEMCAKVLLFSLNIFLEELRCDSFNGFSTVIRCFFELLPKIILKRMYKTERTAKNVMYKYWFLPFRGK